MAVRLHRSAPVLSDSNIIIKGANISEHYGVIEFDSLDEALINKPDIVFVTNPTSMHIAAAKIALKSGAFIFIEKPISHNYDGIEELIKILLVRIKSLLGINLDLIQH